jgi:hypothetical protein
VRRFVPTLVFVALVVSAAASTRSPSDPPPASKTAGRTVRDDAPAAMTVAAEMAKAREGLVERLDRLATWCNDKELFLERDRIWQKVLELAPDDPVARKGLRYARNIDGSWKDPAPREARNLGKKWLEDLPKREEAAYAPYGDVLVALARAPERPAAEREALIAEVRACAPNHAGLHEWLGDVKVGDRWMMPETAAAKERRPAIRAEVKRLLETGAPITTVAPSGPELALGVTWRSALQGENVRLLSTGPEEEALKIARACESAGRLLEFVFGTEMRYPGGFTIYVVGEAERAAFLAALPDLTAADRTRLGGLTGTGIPGTTNVALFAPDLTLRTDNAVRHTIGYVLATTLAVSHKSAWAWEGIGQYLTRELVGTRLTWFVSESADPAAPALRGKLMNAESNWIQEAFELLSTGTATPIEDLLHKDLDHLDVAGALTGYALVAYLLEGRPNDLLTFVTRSARGDEPAAITSEVLGRTPAELQTRLVQWLSERR